MFDNQTFINIWKAHLTTQFADMVFIRNYFWVLFDFFISNFQTLHASFSSHAKPSLFRLSKESSEFLQGDFTLEIRQWVLWSLLEFKSFYHPRPCQASSSRRRTSSCSLLGSSCPAQPWWWSRSCPCLSPADTESSFIREKPPHSTPTLNARTARSRCSVFLCWSMCSFNTSDLQLY